jgi:hypothetical protein
MANEYRTPQNVLLLTQQHKDQVEELERLIETKDPQINNILQQHASQIGETSDNNDVLMQQCMKLLKSRKKALLKRQKEMELKDTRPNDEDCRYWWQLEGLEQINFERLLGNIGLSIERVAGLGGKVTPADGAARWKRGTSLRDK